MAIDITTPLVTFDDVKVNASHLSRLTPDEINPVIEDVHIVFIQEYLQRWRNNSLIVGKLKVIEKYLVQHMLTLNIRRPDSESIPGMSKSISVPKDQDLDQTEYGQMARKIAEKIPLAWANDDKPASLVIY